MYNPVSNHRPGSRAAAYAGTYGGRRAFPAPRGQWSYPPGYARRQGAAAARRLAGQAARRLFPPIAAGAALFGMAEELSMAQQGEVIQYPPGQWRFGINPAFVYLGRWGLAELHGYEVDVRGSMEWSEEPPSDFNLYRQFWPYPGGPYAFDGSQAETVGAGKYLFVTARQTAFDGFLNAQQMRILDWYQNRATETKEAYTESYVRPSPIGAPYFPSTAAAAAPVARHRRDWRQRLYWLLNPPRGDVTIDIVPDKGINVHVLSPHPPHPGMRELKGRAVSPAMAAAGHAAFMLWNLVQDWKDWIKIVAKHTPGIHPSYSNELDLLDYFARNPSALFTTDWSAVGISMVGWAVDERFGAKIAKVQEIASQGIGGVVRIREGVTGQTDWTMPQMQGPGAALTDALLEALRDEGLPRVRRGVGRGTDLHDRIIRF